MGKKGPQVQKMKNDMLYVWRRRWRRAGKGREGGEKRSADKWRRRWKTHGQKKGTKLETLSTFEACLAWESA